MDWNKTKTIFIVVFLVLDIFLLLQYTEKKNDSQYAFINSTSTEEVLELEGITYPAPPKQKRMEKYLIAKSQLFTGQEIKKLEQTQKVKIYEQNRINGEFKKSVRISGKEYSKDIDAFVKEQILHGEEYRFWHIDEETNAIIYYQVHDNKMFFNNSKGKVTLFRNDDREIVSYEQTYLTGFESFSDEKELQPALKAVEALLLNGDLAPKSEITKMELGYYNSLQSSTVSQLLVPTWWIVVNGETDLFVNAFDGDVIELNTEEKILE